MRLKSIGHTIIQLESIDSTNSYVLKNTDHLQQHGLVVMTENQTAGRGRAGRKFVSLPGKNLTFSIVLHAAVAVENIGIYSLLAGVAVARTLECYTTTIPRLKWPNDVLINQRKICGILVESTTLPSVKDPVLVMGIGVNCQGSSSDYPAELQPIVTTLFEESKQSIDNQTILNGILSELSQVLTQFYQGEQSALRYEWIDRAQALGKSVRFESSQRWQEGVIEGLGTKGELWIRSHTGERMIHIAGDVIYLEGKDQ